MRLLVVLLVAACGRFQFGDVRDADVVDTATDADQHPDLLAWYPMEGVSANIVGDASGHGHTGLCLTSACPVSQVGRLGNALAFDGANDQIEVTDAAPSLDPPTAFTVTAFYRAASAKTGCPMSKPLGAGQCNSWQLCSLSTGQVYFYTCDASELAQLMSSAAKPAIGMWHHAAIRWNGTTKATFLDGVFDTSQDASVGFDDNPIVIGADHDFGIPTSYFDGAIDDLRYYGRALSDAEIATLAGGG